MGHIILAQWTKKGMVTHEIGDLKFEFKKKYMLKTNINVKKILRKKDSAYSKPPPIAFRD